MTKEQIINTLMASARYLRETRLPIGEVESIERILGCARAIEDMAEELKAYDGDNEPGDDVRA